ncbi:MAG: hypothetical protein K8I27_09035 [Planctomycetes bacterium]|nr:hypothetical protein [Planctomycetota bacterium]
MFFFDFAFVMILGAGAFALIVGMIALVTGVIRRERSVLVDGDCRDRVLIVHGEGSRNCN